MWRAQNIITCKQATAELEIIKMRRCGRLILIISNFLRTQGPCTMNCPGATTLITPSHVHMHLDIAFSPGRLFTITVGAPGAHGDVMMGRHGTGVGTPAAALVAEINAGFVGAMHIPNGGMLVIGTKSIMVAASGPPIITGGPLGVTTSVLIPGGTANVHCSVAPIATVIADLLYRT
jgi:hypothetical protein